MNIYSIRYSVNRKIEYQIKTIIYELNGIKYVCKEPFTKKAINHNQKIYANYLMLKNSNLNIITPTKKDNNIIFPFVEGENFATILLNDVKANNIEAFIEKLLWYKNLLVKEEKIDFIETLAFRETFGSYNCLRETKAFKISNIDLNFENLIIDNDGNYTIIDYEWVFDFPIPASYVLYRAAYLFLDKYYAYLKNFTTEEFIFNLFEIDNSLIATYKKMEKKFLEKVGGGWAKQSGGYFKGTINKEEILSEISHQDVINDEDYIQIFWSESKEFCEQDSHSLKINGNNCLNIFELDLPNISIKNLRIDPGAIGAYVNMNIAVYSNKEKYNLTDCFSNFIGIKDINTDRNLLNFINTSYDPQLIFEEVLLREGKKKLVIKLFHTKDDEIIIKNTLNHMNESKSITKNLIHSLESKEYELEKFKFNTQNKINELEKQIQLKTKQNVELNKEMQKIISTKGWRILEFFRKYKL